MRPFTPLIALFSAANAEGQYQNGVCEQSRMFYFLSDISMLEASGFLCTH